MAKVKIPTYEHTPVWIKSYKDWSHRLYKIPQLHKQGFRGRGISVAVIDTGINPKHYDFEKAFKDGRLAIHSTVGDKGIDIDGHGSWCSSRFIGETLGYMPDCQLYSIKALGDHGEGSLGSVLAAFDLALDKGVDIISASIGWPADKGEAFAPIIERAKSQGTLIFAASGNDGRKNDMDAPACYHGVISVGGFNADMERAMYTDYSRALDLYAPGDGKGAYTGQAVAHLAGTSMATPTAAACYGLVRDFLIKTTGHASYESVKKIVSCL